MELSPTTAKLFRYKPFPTNETHTPTVSIDKTTDQDEEEKDQDQRDESLMSVINSAPFPYSRYISYWNNSNTNSPVTCDDDFNNLGTTLMGLYEGKYYYPDMSSDEARAKLKDCQVGTYLIRDSQSPNHLFTLSYKSPRGPTSIRLVYRNGHFNMDSTDPRIHMFPTLLEMIQYYSTGVTTLKLEGTIDFQLTEPLRHDTPSLKHSARVALNRAETFRGTTEQCLIEMKMRELLIKKEDDVDAHENEMTTKTTCAAMAQYLSEYTHAV